MLSTELNENTTQSVQECRGISGGAGPRAAERRPNILFALADDWSAAFTSIAGDPVVKTPVFDRIARNGILFRNAFVSAPSCTPSRAAMLTGQWHWRLDRYIRYQGQRMGRK